jgi:hypothetical protein
VKYAFLSRALLQANLFLMALILVWFLFLPSRVVLMQYYLFTSPAFGMPGASTLLFFQLHGMRWLNFWLSRSFGTISVTLPVFMFWGTLLFLEYRALLRSRELFADAQAVLWAGDSALLDALHADKNRRAPTILERVLGIFSAHPSISRRIGAVRAPLTVVKPTALRFFFLGYLFSLATFMLSNIAVMISSLVPEYNKLNGDTDIPTVLRAILTFENVETSLLYIVMLLAFGSMYFVIVATLLRSCISIRLARRSTWEWLATTLLQLICAAAGVVVGSVFHPYSQAFQATLASHIMLGRPVGQIFFSPFRIDALINALSLSATLFGTAFLFWLYTGFVLKGTRSRPIRSFEWGLLMVFTVLLVYQAFGVAWFVWTYPELRSVSFYLPGLALCVVYLVITVIILRFISGKIVDWSSANAIPPWATAP